MEPTGPRSEVLARPTGGRATAPSVVVTRRRPADAVGILTVVLVLSFALPARLVYPPLGAAGRPALLVSIGLLVVWVVGRISRDPRISRRQPLRVGAFVLVWTMLLTYAIGLARGLTAVELLASDRFMLLVFGLTGLVLVVADGVADRRRLDLLLRRVTYAAAALSAAGLVSFVTGQNPAAWIRIPGLALNAELIGDVRRGGFGRVAATATHPIEFGVVLGMVLPVAVHYATNGDPRDRRRAWLVAGLIAAGIPLALARSALIAAAVGMLVLGLGWTLRRLLNVCTLAVGVTLAYTAVAPGLLGTLRGLFLNAPDDGSVQVRVDDYGPAWEYVRERPWFGLGPGTFLPDQYRQLDNQALKFVLEVGVVGFVVVFGFLFLAAALALRVAAQARLAGAVEDASLARALAGSVLAGIAVCVTFDAFTYQVYDTVLFLLAGAAGALWRVSRADRTSAIVRGAGP